MAELLRASKPKLEKEDKVYIVPKAWVEEYQTKLKEKDRPYDDSIDCRRIREEI